MLIHPEGSPAPPRIIARKNYLTEEDHLVEEKTVAQQRPQSGSEELTLDCQFFYRDIYRRVRLSENISPSMS